MKKAVAKDEGEVSFLGKISSSISLLLKQIPLFILVMVTISIECFLVLLLIFNVSEIGKIQLAKALPLASDPVARFTTKIDWKTRSIEFDGSASKTYNNKIDKHIWRIDDGISSMDNMNFKHTFAQPGYYEILFSIVDTNGKSDQADCRILFPPTEVEQIAASERTSETGGGKTVYYEWVPKGTFFNYSKLTSKNIGDLRSPFVETGCGFSNTSYNSYDLYQNINDRNYMLRRTLPRIVISILAIPFVYIIFLLLRKKIKSRIA